MTKLLCEYYDQRNRYDHDHQHVVPNPMEEKFVRVTKPFDDDYDRRSTDDDDYLIELPNQMVTRIRKNI